MHHDILLGKNPTMGIYCIDATMKIFENTKLNKIDFFYIFVFFIFKRLK